MKMIKFIFLKIKSLKFHAHSATGQSTFLHLGRVIRPLRYASRELCTFEESNPEPEDLRVQGAVVTPGSWPSIFFEPYEKSSN